MGLLLDYPFSMFSKKKIDLKLKVVLEGTNVFIENIQHLNRCQTVTMPWLQATDP